MKKHIILLLAILTVLFSAGTVLAAEETGLEKREDGLWYYTVDGEFDATYTGLVKAYGTWFYVENGILDWSKPYTGLARYNGDWFYVQDSVLDWNKLYNGLVRFNGDWFYVKNNVLDWVYPYTGLVHYNGDWFYVNRNVLDWPNPYTGLVNYNNSWFYVSRNLVDWVHPYTGLVGYAGSEFYVQNNLLNWAVPFTGVTEQNGTLVYVAANVADRNYTGLAEYNGEIYLFTNGAAEKHVHQWTSKGNGKMYCTDCGETADALAVLKDYITANGVYEDEMYFLGLKDTESGEALQFSVMDDGLFIFIDDYPVSDEEVSFDFIFQLEMKQSGEAVKYGWVEYLFIDEQNYAYVTGVLDASIFTMNTEKLENIYETFSTDAAEGEEPVDAETQEGLAKTAANSLKILLTCWNDYYTDCPVTAADFGFTAFEG